MTATPDAPAVCRWCGEAIAFPRLCPAGGNDRVGIGYCQPTPPAGVPAVESFPCAHPGCTTTRTRAQGGAVFTVCDEHWQKGAVPRPLPAPATPVDAAGEAPPPFAGYDGGDYPRRWTSAAAVAMAERSDLLDAYRRADERERACDVQRLNERDRADMLRAQLDASEADAHRSGGILCDVCDVAFGDESRAEVHEYDGIVERVRAMCEVVKLACLWRDANAAADKACSDGLDDGVCEQLGSDEVEAGHRLRAAVVAYRAARTTDTTTPDATKGPTDGT